MKKNKMMRIASFLLVAVLMSTCAISGTFAKYVTADDATDSARVAKWGVTVTTTGTLFADAYKDIPVTYNALEQGDTITVRALTQSQNVVAPGTKNEEGMTFVLTGTPEVDVSVVIAVEYTDIQLAAGEYSDPTTGDADDTFTLATDYYPVQFTLTNGNGVKLVSGNLKAINDYLVGLSGEYDANTDLAKIGTDTDGTYKLTWAWAFENQDDQADTILGHLMAETNGYNVVKIGPNNSITTLTTSTDNTTDVTTIKAGESTVGCLTVAFGISITVTQED